MSIILESVEPKLQYITFCAPCHGTVRALCTLPDAMFRDRIYGDGFAIEPMTNEDGDIVSPISGIITAIDRTHAAVTIQTTHGLDVQVQTGLYLRAAVAANAHIYVKEGLQVQTGERLMYADLYRLRMHGIEATCIVFIKNHQQIDAWMQKCPAGQPVRAGRTPVFSISIKQSS